MSENIIRRAMTRLPFMRRQHYDTALPAPGTGGAAYLPSAS